jgi:hypothetical protein
LTSDDDVRYGYLCLTSNFEHFDPIPQAIQAHQQGELLLDYPRAAADDEGRRLP